LIDGLSKPYSVLEEPRAVGTNGSPLAFGRIAQNDPSAGRCRDRLAVPQTASHSVRADSRSAEPRVIGGLAVP